jgi:hypothetical protein
LARAPASSVRFRGRAWPGCWRHGAPRSCGTGTTRLRGLGVAGPRSHPAGDLAFPLAEVGQGIGPTGLAASPPRPHPQGPEPLGGQACLGAGAHLLGQGAGFSQHPAGFLGIHLGEHGAEVQADPDRLQQQPLALGLSDQRFQEGGSSRWVALQLRGRDGQRPGPGDEPPDARDPWSPGSAAGPRRRSTRSGCWS